MGNGASSPEPEDYPDEFAKFDGVETLGYRVLGVQPNSPASVAGLVSFLDFLVGCNGEMLLASGEGLEEGDEYDDVDFPALLKDNVGRELELLVHNIKSNSQRLVKITPSTTWGGAGLLGVTIRMDDYGGADERLIRVLSVEHNSPAAIAGLVPMKDYLLGTASTSFDSDAILAEVLMMHADRIVELYVYSSESDVVRVITLMPTLSWGGRGLLGAEVGTGYLHGFPKACRGTDGTSVERKIRMGVRPTETVLALEKLNGKRDTNDKDEELSQEVKEEEGMVDMTSLTDTLSGKAMCFAEQMEMEPEPADESVNHSKQSTGEQVCEQEPSQPSIGTTNAHFVNSRNDANSLFDGPPPNDGIFSTPAKSPLPPPPYYCNSHDRDKR
ncbi:hypothetical protein ACHAW5_000024 [Stephanodiscus triporus]|uniref:PDZ GRASP-type domain-containing protein n=1 Tax=Stephanodiscus triporus TaxID=2934178 RepID=A0ABD3QZS9_9STRA